jgi:Na+-transporting NADH:ubiquinone oxidoreductase subunit D
MSKSLITDPLLENNPIMTQLLGICSALAVTTQMKAGLTMAIALTVVITCSNMIISALRKVIPGKIRLIVELCIIATLVSMVDIVLKAYAFDISKDLSVFVGLIITNCIVMGRAEAFALGNPVGKSALDGLGNGFGYGVILLLVSGIREIFGAGNFFGMQVIPDALYEIGYTNIGLMVLAPGAFFLIGLFAWGQKEYLIRKGKA